MSNASKQRLTTPSRASLQRSRASLSRPRNTPCTPWTPGVARATPSNTPCTPWTPGVARATPAAPPQHTLYTLDTWGCQGPPPSNAARRRRAWRRPRHRTPLRELSVWQKAPTRLRFARICTRFAARHLTSERLQLSLCRPGGTQYRLRSSPRLTLGPPRSRRALARCPTPWPPLAAGSPSTRRSKIGRAHV